MVGRNERKLQVLEYVEEADEEVTSCDVANALDLEIHNAIRFELASQLITNRKKKGLLLMKHGFVMGIYWYDASGRPDNESR